jgi:hypothetical protein
MHFLPQSYVEVALACRHDLPAAMRVMVLVEIA